METIGVDARSGLTAAPVAPTAAGVDAVITYHLNPYASGVVRFNELLAQHLGVPFLGFRGEDLSAVRRPLLSFKVGEVAEADRALLSSLIDQHGWRYHFYLHDWSELPQERELVKNAVRVWCGNHEIQSKVRDLHRSVETVWTPGLLTDRRTYQPAEISVFSFGMAHKIQTGMFRRLRNLLAGSGRSYAVYFSGATHETKSIGDAQALFDEMHEIFPRCLYFMGNLSDVAVFNQLQTTTFFASFFPDGVRANNTSVAGAMENGAVVITNLDDHSPPHLEHMKNVIDIQRCGELPSDPLVLKRISVGAMEAARARSWESLAARINPERPDLTRDPDARDAVPEAR